MLPDFYIDWEYVKGQTSSFNGKKNILGDGHTWMHLMQFVEFSDCGIPDRNLQTQHPPLYCLHAAIMAAGTAGKLNFGDACKMLILNNIEGLTTKRMIELHTSSRLNCNTHAICAGARVCMPARVQNPEVLRCNCFGRYCELARRRAARARGV